MMFLKDQNTQLLFTIWNLHLYLQYTLTPFSSDEDKFYKLYKTFNQKSFCRVYYVNHRLAVREELTDGTGLIAAFWYHASLTSRAKGFGILSG